MPLLDAYARSDINQFKNDFFQLLKVHYWLDKDYSLSRKPVDSYLGQYKKLLSLFNRKYKKIKLELAKKQGRLLLKISIKEKNVKDVFANAAKIPGLKGLSPSSFSAEAMDPKAIEKVKDRLFLFYEADDYGTDHILLHFDKKANAVIFEAVQENLSNEKSPSFSLCCFYGLVSFSKNVNLLGKISAFGFVELLSEDEKRRFLEIFDPKLEE